MALEFNVTNILDVMTNTVFGGNTTMAGLVIMLVIFFGMVVILSKVGAPPVYSVVPMIPAALMFASIGYLDTTVSILIVIISVVVVAAYSRHLVGGM